MKMSKAFNRCTQCATPDKCGVYRYCTSTASDSATAAEMRDELLTRRNMTTDSVEQLKFDIRQAMIEYGIACKNSNDAGIIDSSGRCVALVDKLGQAALTA